MRAILTNRFLILAVVMILIAGSFIFRLYDMQIVHGQEYARQSQNQIVREHQVPAPRGRILDRYGVPFAVNRQGFTLQIVTTSLYKDSRKFNLMLLDLIKVLDANGDKYVNTLSKYLQFEPLAFGPYLQDEKALKKWQVDIEQRKGEGVGLNSPAAVFEYLRKRKFSIPDEVSDADAYKIMCIRYEMLMTGCNSYNPMVVARDIHRESIAQIEERHNDFPGLSTFVEPYREYTDAETAAHVIGYVQNIDADTLKAKNALGLNYRADDVIGKSGIERSSEDYLRGKPGSKRVEFDAFGRIMREVVQTPAVPGGDVYLTLDARIQKVAMNSLAQTIEDIRNNNDPLNKRDAFAGAVVAMDVQSGEVLAMASYPTYSPSIFLAGAENKEAQKAIVALSDPKNTTTSEFNRALTGQYTPGSTYKPVVAVAGLEEGVISPETTILDEGIIDVDGQKFTCMEYRLGLGAHGYINMEHALASSCNIFFQKLGMMTTIDKIEKWARLFGLGVKTDIGLTPESTGIIASKDYKKKTFGEQNGVWGRADTAQSSIGQLYNAYTPLQLCNYVSTLANGGKRFKPTLVRKVTRYDGAAVTESRPEFEQLPISKTTLDSVKKGMIAVTNATDGTAVGIFDDLMVDGTRVKVAGKTGTAETGNEKNASSNALFVCYAPAENPKIAVAVVVEHGVFGAYTAPVARDILMEYFRVNNVSGQAKAAPAVPELTR